MVERKENFIVGEWYACSCNTNLYRFLEIRENEYFIHDAQINKSNYLIAECKPGYTEKTFYGSLLIYFNSERIADINVVNRFSPKIRKIELYHIF